MHLVLLGLNHRSAPVEVRERVDFQASGLNQALRGLGSDASIAEAVVLSTCNRVELYAACTQVPQGRTALVEFVGRFHHLPAERFEPHLYEFTDASVARHLFRVAAGLDSLVVGEPQILGQVKEAHVAAAAERMAGPLLNRLFHSSFAVGKRVRAETALGAGAVSVGFAAVSLARKIFGALKGLDVLVVGAGEMGKLTALHLKSQGVDRITIVSRTMAHAAQTAEAIGGASAAPWDELDAAIGRSDIVITATGAAAPVLTKAHVETVMRTRRNRPLFIVDIAMPRDVEAEAGEIEQVFLYNIDDLQTTVRENMARRAAEVARAESIVDEEVERFSGWLRSRGAIPTLVALRQRFEEIRRSELERLNFKLGSLPPDSRARVDEITHLIVEKLLLTPTEQLKQLRDADTIGAYTEAVTRLFGLGDQDGDRATGTDRPAGKVEPFSRPGGRGRR
jgi:glutamyl-tRNA reductase